jgi:hypothetical protein
MKNVVISALAGVACTLAPAMAADRTRSAWPAETLSGTIEMVDPGQKLVVVEGPYKALFDMVVTPETRIKAGHRVLRIDDLSRYQNQPVSIRFVPERRGDVAQSMEISG